MDAIITTAQIAQIVLWAREQKPLPMVSFTNFKEGIGADGVLIEFDTLTVDQAHQLLELRRQLDCHVSIGNQKNLDQVVFDRLYPHDNKQPY